LDESLNEQAYAVCDDFRAAISRLTIENRAHLLGSLRLSLAPSTLELLGLGLNTLNVTIDDIYVRVALDLSGDRPAQYVRTILTGPVETYEPVDPSDKYMNAWIDKQAVLQADEEFHIRRDRA
jgi:hypothetical protein